MRARDWPREAAQRVRQAEDRAAAWGYSAFVALRRAVSNRRDFALSIAAVLLYFWPAITSGGVYASFLYPADVIGWYTPTLLKTHQMLSALQFTGLDYSRFNGSADFFLTPIFYYFHPLVVLYGLFAPDSWATVRGASLALLALEALHLFLATYFTMKLARRHLGLSFGMACLLATLLPLSVVMVLTVLQPSFLICVSVLPWLLCAMLDRSRDGAGHPLLLASLPAVLCLLAGYVPLSAATLGVAAAFALFFIGSRDRALDGVARARAITRALAPLVVAALVTAPLMVAIYDFHQAALSSRPVTVEQAAFEWAQHPNSIARLLSTYLPSVGPFFEVSFVAGPAAMMVIAIFLFSRGPLATLEAHERRVLAFCIIAYTLVALSTFGRYSAVSDLVFYLVPQVGKMHVYQRFLFPAQLCFAVALVLMFKAVTANPPLNLLRAMVGIALTGAFAVAWILGLGEKAPNSLVTEFLVVELLLMAALAAAMLFGDRRMAIATAVVVFGLPALDRIYDTAAAKFSYLSFREAKPMDLDVDTQRAFVAYVRSQFPDRDVVRYVDLTPLWYSGSIETFPKNFPELVLDQVRLTSYSGRPVHISARKDYAARFPLEGVALFRQDWAFLRDTGADLVIVSQNDLASGAAGPALAQALAVATPAEVYQLPHDAVAFPLRLVARTGPAPETLWENGVFRVLAPAGAPASAFKMTQFSFNFVNHATLAFDAASPVVLRYLFFPNPRLQFFLDGQRLDVPRDAGHVDITAPAGRHTLEVRYRHGWLAFFWCVYAVYGVGVLLAWILSPGRPRD